MVKSHGKNLKDQIVAFRMDPESLAALDEFAENEGFTRSDYLRAVVTELLGAERALPTAVKKARSALQAQALDLSARVHTMFEKAQAEKAQAEKDRDEEDRDEEDRDEEDQGDDGQAEKDRDEKTSGKKDQDKKDKSKLTDVEKEEARILELQAIMDELDEVREKRGLLARCLHGECPADLAWKTLDQARDDCGCLDEDCWAELSKTARLIASKIKKRAKLRAVGGASSEEHVQRISEELLALRDQFLIDYCPTVGGEARWIIHPWERGDEKKKLAKKALGLDRKSGAEPKKKLAKDEGEEEKI